MSWSTILKARKLRSNFHIAGKEIGMGKSEIFQQQHLTELKTFKNIVESLYDRLDVKDVFIPGQDNPEWFGVLMVIFKMGTSISDPLIHPYSHTYELRISIDYKFKQMNIRLIDHNIAMPDPGVAADKYDFYMGMRKPYTLNDKETIIREITELMEEYK
tara:strand:+ start:443 stop:919 length:477 start_codon:yes stop_codon:yes gene_type:complete